MKVALPNCGYILLDSVSSFPEPRGVSANLPLEKKFLFHDGIQFQLVSTHLTVLQSPDIVKNFHSISSAFFFPLFIF